MYTLNHNVSHEPLQGVTLHPSAILPTQFREVKRDAVSLTYNNVSIPTIETPETYRIAQRNLSDIYGIAAGSVIPQVSRSPRKRGVNLETSLYQTWSEEDAADSAAPVWLYPISGKTILNIPAANIITVADIQQFMMDMLGFYFTPEGESRLAAMLRGAISIKE
jgi:hypothetical protein